MFSKVCYMKMFICSVSLKIAILLATGELRWLEHLWNHEKMLETAVVRANEC